MSCSDEGNSSDDAEQPPLVVNEEPIAQVSQNSGQQADGKQNLPCDECDAILGNSNLLKRHVQDKHKNVRKHGCPYPPCEKAFKRKEHLERHIRIHTGDKPFKCDICDAKFTQKEHLKGHTENVHLKNKKAGKQSTRGGRNSNGRQSRSSSASPDMILANGVNGESSMAMALAQPNYPGHQRLLSANSHYNFESEAALSLLASTASASNSLSLNAPEEERDSVSESSRNTSSPPSLTSPSLTSPSLATNYGTISPNITGHPKLLTSHNLTAILTASRSAGAVTPLSHLQSLGLFNASSSPESLLLEAASVSNSLGSISLSVSSPRGSLRGRGRGASRGANAAKRTSRGGGAKTNGRERNPVTESYRNPVTESQNGRNPVTENNFSDSGCEISTEKRDGSSLSPTSSNENNGSPTTGEGGASGRVTALYAAASKNSTASPQNRIKEVFLKIPPNI